jgi:hypothetical protein
MSPEEILALFTPQRRINPTTGAAVPKRAASGQMEANFGVPGAVDPYEALLKLAMERTNQGARTVGNAAAYPFTPNTWNGRQVINPNGQFGGKIMEYSPTQKAAAGAAGTGALIGTGVGLDNAMHPAAQAAGMPSSANMNRADAAGIDEMSAYPPLHPSSEFMNRANAQGIDELSAYPSRPSSSFMDRSDRPGVDETSAYLNPLDRSGPSETSAYPHGAVHQQDPAARSAPASAPMPPTRPAELAREQPSILSRIFSGENFQSNNQPVNKPMGGAPVNWGNSDSAADFFRADKALQQARPEMFKKPADEGMSRGGSAGNSGANGKDAALHKALEIIHHMLTQRH